MAVRHSGSYPWPQEKKYMFADYDDIYNSMRFLENLYSDCIMAKYSRRGLTVVHTVDKETISMEENFRRDIANCLARQYERVCKEEVLKMTGTDINALDAFIRANNGSVAIVDSGLGFDGCKAVIEIPLRALSGISIGPKEKKSKEDNSLPKVWSVETFNDRAVIVHFADGTQTKSVCSKNDTFNLETGIMICLFKRILGDEGHKKFNDLIRDAYKAIDMHNEAEMAVTNALAEEKERQARKAEKRKARKEKKRAEQVDILAEGVKEAFKRLDMPFEPRNPD